MAITADLSGNNPTDQPHYTHNRTLETSPVAVAVPGYVGEVVMDRSSNQLWRGTGLTNLDWVPLVITRRTGAVSR